jgi:hypothetical protein
VIASGVLCICFFPAAAAALTAHEGEYARRPLRETLLIAAALWSVWLVIGTELLSLAGVLRPGPLTAWWLIPTAAMALLVARDRRWLTRLRGAWQARRRPDWLTLSFLGALALILLATAVVAAVTPPNNWDSQTYHLPRQVHWMQQGSVAHFATPDLRQVMMPPLAEFAGLHFMILTGGDAWANLISWFALAMTAVAASLIARELGARARGQSLAAVLVVTNPMAAMGAVNTKNDLVVALWGCAMAYFVLKVWTERRCPPGRAALIGATLGLMVLTKGTGLIVGLPISLGAAVAILSVQRWRGLLTGAAIGAIALALNVGHFGRNIQEFGSPNGATGVQPGLALSNEILSPAAIASSLVRNVSLHAGTPWDDVNTAAESAIGRLHDAMGIDPSDPRTTYLDLRFTVFHNPYNESQAPAPLHLLLGLLVVPVLLALQRRRLLLVATLVPYAAFVLFCIVLKWQPWHVRLHLPIVCLLAPVAATLLEGVWRGALAAVIATLAVLIAAPSILWNQHKPLLGSPSIFTATWEENMFRGRRGLVGSFREAIDACIELEPRSLVILRAGEQWMYPFHRVLLDTMPQPPEFVSLAKHKAQRRDYELAPPDIIIHTKGGLLWMDAHGMRYVPAAFCGQYEVLVPKAVADARGLNPAPPPFIGWRNSEGLDRLEGPYPQWDLPQVRWGLGPATTLVFHGDGKPATLILEGRRNDRRDQSLVVRLNGEEIARHEFGKFEFRELRVPLAPKRGSNELVLEYGAWNTETPRATAVLFRRLQILPAEHGEEAGEPGG